MNLSTNLNSDLLSILVVDDNRDVADTLAVVLGGSGYDVTEAFDGDEAVRQIERGGFDVVLCDIGLPGRSGYDVARHVRRSAGSKPLMVAISAYSTPAVIAEARSAGFDAFFAKPTDPEKIENLLKDYAARHNESKRTDFIPVGK